MSKTDALEWQKNYEYKKYYTDLKHHFLKRYQSRANNFFGEEKHKAVDLLNCTPGFFLKWIKFCLKDTNRARTPLSKIEIAHVIPVTSDKNNLKLWHWTNCFPCLEKENLEQGNDRIPTLEKQQASRVNRFIKKHNLKTGGDIHAFLSKLPLSNTPLKELHYWHPIDRKFDAYTGPGTKLEIRCEPDCVGDKPKPFNSTDYVYDGVSRISHQHDHDYEEAENSSANTDEIKGLKLEADRKMLRALENLNCNSFGERVKKKIVQGIIGLKVKLGLGIEEMPLAELLGLGISMDSYLFKGKGLSSSSLANKVDKVLYKHPNIDFTQNPEITKNRAIVRMIIYENVFNSATWLPFKQAYEKLIELNDPIFTTEDFQFWRQFWNNGTLGNGITHSRPRDTRTAVEIKIERLKRLRDNILFFEPKSPATLIAFKNVLENLIELADNEQEKTRLWDFYTDYLYLWNVNGNQNQNDVDEIGLGLSLVAQELHKPIVKKFEKRRIFFNYLDEIHSMDLMEMPSDKGYKFILILIDNWSKFLWAIALKNKTGEQVKQALKALFLSTKRIPKKIHADKGKEFYNKQVLELFKENNIKLYSTQNLEKSAIAERTIGVLRSWLEPLLTEEELKGNKASWMNKLPEVINRWNFKHISKVTGLTPNDGSLPENQDKIKSRYQEIRSVRRYDPKPLSVGTYCRIYEWKYKFDKGSKKNWTNEIFRIKRIQNTNPKTYILEDKKGEEITGSFYRSELLPSKFGFDNS